MKKILGLPIFAAIFLLMVIPPSPFPIANAAGLIVPKDYPTIQDAIDNASEGDTILVLKGTYTEQLTIDKNLKIQGAGAKTTTIKAPAVLANDTLDRPYIIFINSGAKVTIKGFTIKGPDGTVCPRLQGVSVLQDSTLILDSSVIKGCVATGITVGRGEEIGHATITKTDIIDYRSIGIFTFGDGSTLKFSSGKVVADPAPEAVGPTGIEVLIGAKGAIQNSEIIDNICINPECGDDFLTQTQGAGMVFFDAASGSIILNNLVSNNDIGIAVGGNSGCCKITQNKLNDNPFFGMTIFDGSHTSVNDKIKGGDIGVAAVATFADTIATLVNDKITETTTPVEELECCGFNAEIVTVPRNSFQTSQFKSSQTSDVDSDFLIKKFAIEDEVSSQSNSAISPF